MTDSDRLHILIVEDDPDHAELIQEHLRLLHHPSFTWEWVPGLNEAIDYIGACAVDIILLDLRLPGVEFPETLTRLMPVAEGIPIIVLTALDDEDLALAAVREGAQDYLVKTDLSSRLLLRAIRYANERAQHRASLERMNGRLRAEVKERLNAEAALRKREVELEALNADLEKRVAARTATLAWANRQLEIRNRELQEFAFVASHDLQEPLRKIQAFATLLRDEMAEGLSDEAAMCLGRMTGAASRMSRLIADLLVFSRVGTRSTRFVRVDLNEVARSVRDDVEALLEEQGARLDIAPLPTVEADPRQMHQLLFNLVSNALKFRRPAHPPHVVVSARLQEEAPTPTARLVVEDNGIGFDMKYHNRIFTPFQRLHGRSEFEGTGMGLAICRRIIERHGGAIGAESAPGEGSRFFVDLPVRHVAPPAG